MADDLGLAADQFLKEWTRTFPRRQRNEFASLSENIKLVLDELGYTRSMECVDAVALKRIEFERIALQPRPGTIDFLRSLRLNGLKIGIVSNCSMEAIEAWDSSLLKPHVDHVTFSCLVGSEKPSPTIYNESCKSLSVVPTKCIFVGDGSNDELEGAMRTGMKSVLIRASDDDGSFPGRIDPGDWDGDFVSHVEEVAALLG